MGHTLRANDWRGEYQAARSAVALHEHRSRGVVEITGADRAPWLHNLTTNQVKTLQAGEGVYTFFLDIKGRVIADANVLIRPESIWLGVARARVPDLLTHLRKHVITEDVLVTDRMADCSLLSIIGPRAVDLLAEVGVRQASALAMYGSMPGRIDGVQVLVLRHDLYGAPAFDLLGEPEAIGHLRDGLERVGRPFGVRVAGDDAVNALRIEHGMPWAGYDIDESVLPAETGQIQRAVSFQKGCYLGQEVVERMRSRQVVARRLVGLRFDGPHLPPLPSPLWNDRGEVGRVTSLCDSPGAGALVGLGYVKTAAAAAGTALAAVWPEQRAACTTIDLPVVGDTHASGDEKKDHARAGRSSS